MVSMNCDLLRIFLIFLSFDPVETWFEVFNCGSPMACSKVQLYKHKLSLIRETREQLKMQTFMIPNIQLYYHTI